MLCLLHDTITMSVERPTEDKYEQLALSIGSALECPCAQLSFLHMVHLWN